MCTHKYYEFSLIWIFIIQRTIGHTYTDWSGSCCTCWLDFKRSCYIIKPQHKFWVRSLEWQMQYIQMILYILKSFPIHMENVCMITLHSSVFHNTACITSTKQQTLHSVISFTPLRAVRLVVSGTFNLPVSFVQLVRLSIHSSKLVLMLCFSWNRWWISSNKLYEKCLQIMFCVIFKLIPWK